MRITEFAHDNDGAITVDWIVLSGVAVLLAVGAIGALKTGMFEVSKGLTAVVERQIDIPTGSAPDANSFVTSMRFGENLPEDNSAKGITFAAPNVSMGVAMPQFTMWTANVMSATDIEQGRARVATLSEPDLQELSSFYLSYVEIDEDSSQRDQILADKFHIVLNELEARGLEVSGPAIRTPEGLSLQH